MVQHKQTLSAIGLLVIAVIGFFGITPPVNAAIMCDFSIGDLVKVEGNPHVYAIGTDWKLHHFANEKIFFTWNQNFHGVQAMLPACMEEFGLGKPMPYRPGSTLLKTSLDSTIYMVEPGAILHPIDSEAAVQHLFGSQWMQHVTTVSEPELLLYTINNSDTPLSFGEGTLLKPHGDVFVYTVQYGTIFRVEGDLPEQLKARVQNVPLTTFNDYLNSQSLIGVGPTSIPTISVADLFNNEFERTTSIQLPHEQMRLNRSFQSKLMAKTYEEQLSVRMTPSGGEASNEFSEILFQMISSVDRRICTNEKTQVTASVDVSLPDTETPVTIEFELRVFESPLAMYLKINSLDLSGLGTEEMMSEVLPMLEMFTGQWIKLDLEALSMLGEQSIADLMPTCEEKMVAEKAITNMLGNSNILVVTENFGADTLDGAEYYHYGFTVNPSSIKYLVSSLAAQSNSPLSAGDLMELDEAFDEVTDVLETRNGELWIGKADNIIHAIGVDLVVRDEDGNQAGFINIDYSLDKLNGEMNIEAPTDTTDLMELLTNIIAESETVRVSARDAARISNIRMLQTGLELYYVDNGAYPVEAETLTLGWGEGSCLDETGFGSTCSNSAYISDIKPDPSFYNYTYSSTNGSTYTIEASLESDYNSLKAGEIIANPSGVANVQ